MVVTSSNSSLSIFVFPHHLPLGQDVSLHGLQQFLFARADPRFCLSTAGCSFRSVQVKHGVQSVEPEVIAKG